MEPGDYQVVSLAHGNSSYPPYMEATIGGVVRVAVNGNSVTMERNISLSYSNSPVINVVDKLSGTFNPVTGIYLAHSVCPLMGMDIGYPVTLSQPDGGPKILDLSGYTELPGKLDGGALAMRILLIKK